MHAEPLIDALHGGADIPVGNVPDVLPHRGTMLLLDAIERCSETGIEVSATVRRDAWYADGSGAMPAWIGIELMAQAIAAHVGLLAAHAGGRAKPGVLLGANRYVAHRTTFGADTVLRIVARELLRGDEGHGAYECAIHAEGQCCAEAVVKVYQPNDFQSFIEGSFNS
ncbi:MULTISPECIES: hotdog family protein [Burkholderia]|uniref:hotdog family protein n=1 Tax=Burkholderia TaxID=32008 RepID=UPI000757B531|nr:MULTISPECIES: hotdog family protein [Burkholderia]AOJ89181.1 beta-hydroxyacyl-ACP dehydratase [Burkholderia sp. MSMB0856]KUZ00674.1 beta-hydroxyacyl-ACP dehydratase [Burkholderia sp. RF7-non_BP1]KUZ04449.1 beta-hydroxyacyl-ACP dehydratase [Burkholderia sp. RF7-non_BP4]KVH34047.1 beta-hydroxyacyl-ACP dehydratase [Burkholderia sp. MSMB0856]